MTPDDLKHLRGYIEAAHRLTEVDQPQAAVHLFAAAREFVSARVDQGKLDDELARQAGNFWAEREFYRTAISSMASAEAKDAPPVVIISDSLGLPRPEAKGTPRNGAEQIFASLLAEALPDRRIDPICQRFFTTGDAVALLAQEPDLGRGSDVIIHLGLNDTARRMFLERQRVALSFVPAGVRQKIVGFAQKWRREILRHLPALHYTAPDQFAANLDLLANTFKARKARRIIFATIVVPPLKFWRSTPDMATYFGKYNMILMETAMRHDILLLDLDRHVWANLRETPLDADGMHLSPVGHEIFCAELKTLLE